MSRLVAPIYTGTLNSKPLRFFRAPFQEPHLPWHSFDDLMCCIGVRQSHRDEVLSGLRCARVYDVGTVACGSEILVTAPNYAARWFIKNVRGSMRNRPKLDLTYRIAMIGAWYASMQNRPACEAESLLLRAIRNTDQAEAGLHAA
jgi:hypothetical protein